MNDRLRFYEKDVFRFVAALSVVLFHYTYYSYTVDKSLLSFSSVGAYSKYGYLGVDLFLMINGFAILLTALNKDTVGFTTSRVTRFFPASWASLLYHPQIHGAENFDSSEEAVKIGSILHPSKIV